MKFDAPFTAPSIETGGLDETRRAAMVQHEAPYLSLTIRIAGSGVYGVGGLARLNSLLFLLRTDVRVSHGEKVNSSSS